MKLASIPVMVVFSLTLMMVPAWAGQQSADVGGASKAEQARPTVFIPNLGQWDGDFRYRSTTGGMTVFLQDQGWTFILREQIPDFEEAMNGRLESRAVAERKLRSVAIEMRFLHTADSGRWTPESKMPGVHNYFLGNDESRWRRDVPLHGSVLLEGLLPGVSVRAKEEGGHFKYDLLVEPDVDPSGVEIEVRGARGMRLDERGRLVIETELGDVVQPRPQTWQVLESGRRRPIDAAYEIRGNSVFGFSLPGLAPGLPLVIDPGLLAGTHVGGASDDYVSDVAPLVDGSILVGGTTRTPSFHSPGVFDGTIGGVQDGYVALFDARASQLVFATFIGGLDKEDYVNQVDVDASGVVTLVGSTKSSDFPTTLGAHDRALVSGTRDGYVARISSSGSQLLAATLFGGNGDDVNLGLRRFPGVAMVVAGYTYSNDLPVTVGAIDASYNGNTDIYFAVYDDMLTSLTYCSYFGGPSYDNLHFVSIDAQGVATLCGQTGSLAFFSTPGAYVAPGIMTDAAFVSRVDLPNTNVVFSLLYGGNSTDLGTCVDVDPVGDVVLVGYSYSSNLPTTIGALGQPVVSLPDAYVAHFDASGTTLLSATYLGGTDYDAALSVVFDAAGRIVVAGATKSVDFPTTAGAHGTAYIGGLDGFLTCLDVDGTSLFYSTYMGAGADNVINDIALDSGGTLVYGGFSRTATFLTTPGAQSGAALGLADGVLGRFDLGLSGLPVLLSGTTVQAGGDLHLALSGPPAANFAVVFDGVPWNVPAGSYGTLGLPYPPGPTALVLDGTGLFNIGLATYQPLPLQINANGTYFLDIGPVPSGLVGLTLFAQAFVQDASYPLGWGISGNVTTYYGIPSTPILVVP